MRGRRSRSSPSIFNRVLLSFIVAIILVNGPARASLGGRPSVRLVAKRTPSSSSSSSSSSSGGSTAWIGRRNHKQEEGTNNNEANPLSRLFALGQGYVSLHVGKVMDEIRYQWTSLDTYRQDVQAKMDASLERFQKTYERASKELRKDVDTQLHRATALQEEYMNRIASQQQRLSELTKTEVQNRKKGFSQSLEQFKKQYDNTWEKVAKGTKKLGPLTKSEIKAQQTRLDEALTQFMAQYRNSSAEVRGYFERMVQFSADVFPKLSLEEDHVKGLIQSLREEERGLLSRLVGKPDLRSERARLEAAVENLRHEKEKMMKKIKEQRQELDGNFKKVLDQLMSFNKIYDDLIMRKESKLYAESMNDKVLRRVLDCLDQTEGDGWEFVVEKHGVKVHRKHMPTLDGRMSKYVCVKATGVIDASPDAIVKLFNDNLRVAEYNKFYAEGRDLEDINENTKVVWASSPPMFFFKPRDFCTVVHYRKLKDGTICVVNRGAEHPDAPRTDRYVRAEILMGANIIQPIKGQSKKSVMSIVTQIDPGGFAPPVVVNKVCALGPINFFKDIEAAAQRPPPKTRVVNKDFKM